MNIVNDDGEDWSSECSSCESEKEEARRLDGAFAAQFLKKFKWGVAKAEQSMAITAEAAAGSARPTSKELMVKERETEAAAKDMMAGATEEQLAQVREWKRKEELQIVIAQTLKKNHVRPPMKMIELPIVGWSKPEFQVTVSGRMSLVGSIWAVLFLVRMLHLLKFKTLAQRIRLNEAHIAQLRERRDNVLTKQFHGHTKRSMQLHVSKSRTGLVKTLNAAITDSAARTRKAKLGAGARRQQQQVLQITASPHASAVVSKASTLVMKDDTVGCDDNGKGLPIKTVGSVLFEPNSYEATPPGSGAATPMSDSRRDKHALVFVRPQRNLFVTCPYWKDLPYLSFEERNHELREFESQVAESELTEFTQMRIPEPIVPQETLHVSPKRAIEPAPPQLTPAPRTARLLSHESSHSQQSQALAGDSTSAAAAAAAAPVTARQMSRLEAWDRWAQAMASGPSSQFNYLAWRLKHKHVKPRVYDFREEASPACEEEAVVKQPAPPPLKTLTPRSHPLKVKVMEPPPPLQLSASRPVEGNDEQPDLATASKAANNTESGWQKAVAMVSSARFDFARWTLDQNRARYETMNTGQKLTGKAKERMRKLASAVVWDQRDSQANYYEQFLLHESMEHSTFINRSEQELQRLITAKHNFLLPWKREAILKQTDSGKSFFTSRSNALKAVKWRILEHQRERNMSYNMEWLHQLKESLLAVLDSPTPSELKVFSAFEAFMANAKGDRPLNPSEFFAVVEENFTDLELEEPNVQFLLLRVLPAFGAAPQLGENRSGDGEGQKRKEKEKKQEKSNNNNANLAESQQQLQGATTTTNGSGSPRKDGRCSPTSPCHQPTAIELLKPFLAEKKILFFLLGPDYIAAQDKLVTMYPFERKRAAKMEHIESVARTNDYFKSLDGTAKAIFQNEQQRRAVEDKTKQTPRRVSEMWELGSSVSASKSFAAGGGSVLKRSTSNAKMSTAQKFVPRAPPPPPSASIESVPFKRSMMGNSGENPLGTPTAAAAPTPKPTTIPPDSSPRLPYLHLVRKKNPEK